MYSGSGPSSLKTALERMNQLPVRPSGVTSAPAGIVPKTLEPKSGKV